MREGGVETECRVSRVMLSEVPACLFGEVLLLVSTEFVFFALIFLLSLPFSIFPTFLLICVQGRGGGGGVSNTFCCCCVCVLLFFIIYFLLLLH